MGTVLHKTPTAARLQAAVLAAAAEHRGEPASQLVQDRAEKALKLQPHTEYL